jgi:hypothetical protein
MIRMWKTRSHSVFQSSCCRIAAPAVQADVKPMSLLQSQHQWKGWEYDGFKSLSHFFVPKMEHQLGIFSKPVDLWSFRRLLHHIPRLPRSFGYQKLERGWWKGSGPGVAGGNNPSSTGSLSPWSRVKNAQDSHSTA